MPTEMKTFKRFSAAKKAAKGEPILKVGDTFLVGVKQQDGHYTEITLIAPEGCITGSITVQHLDRLGNGNHAIANDPHSRQRAYVWPPKAESTGEVL
jgi:hypothetical protein